MPQFEFVRTFMRHILTEADGESYDLIRVLALCFGASFAIGGMGGFGVIVAWGVRQLTHHALDVGAYSTALATSFGAFAAGCATLMPAIGFALAKRAQGEGPSVPDKPAEGGEK
ncbi:hypothetical protein D7S86_27065 [Pararobbsia silviterrae]|uniref:Uncharacterized protein n=2 Tax=Pararobbsia silviterrae TaxID=1792498 RepID=A0A494XAT5_9BURK|nr:hypothetical protein D7S86_27065 [Pararobbsia silviterrae]